MFDRFLILVYIVVVDDGKQSHQYLKMWVSIPSAMLTFLLHSRRCGV